jgi:hypothetical protein
MTMRKLVLLALLLVLLAACDGNSVSGRVVSMSGSVVCLDSNGGDVVECITIHVMTRMDVQRYQERFGQSPYCTFSSPDSNGIYTTVSCTS